MYASLLVPRNCSLKAVLLPYLQVVHGLLDSVVMVPGLHTSILQKNFCGDGRVPTPSDLLLEATCLTSCNKGAFSLMIAHFLARQLPHICS